VVHYSFRSYTLKLWLKHHYEKIDIYSDSVIHNLVVLKI